ncbi:phosphoglycerate mutase-like protein [Sodiomyces alkalinus F11]|uniref:3-phytase n=1 Tax=Sodiomyces alkalinus (strain CBS 110278 / VKM F-3762 / F11) TaxID=1314773 RepID=A0A3N2Q060_SODAK|nr:phosphoglycerate mutase-like protein [Sodiomyces alkalinus F11]ROT40078.1 phosphoglycerate mutase-like protein [Sodiomyces alkalinus F11]
MPAAEKTRQNHPRGYRLVPEGDLDHDLVQGRPLGVHRSTHQRTGDAGDAKRLPDKPLPDLPSIPMPMSPDFSPGLAPGLGSRRRPLIVFLCALAGCLLAGAVLELAWQGTRPPPPTPFEDCPCRDNGSGKPDVPQYFQTTPPMWAGPTATGKAPFVAQTAVLPTGTYSYVPNHPLQTSVPIEGMGSHNESIFKLMGYLTPYEPAPGFGVDEYSLPEGAELIQVQMLSRHGSRYPTLDSGVAGFGEKIKNASGKLTAKGDLEFLNHWSYELGHEILVPKGRSELFESGILHSYMYSQLYDPNTKIIVRTTTQDRMLKSAEYFLAGFFGLEWTNNATIEVIIEQNHANNSLAGYLNCPNSWKQNGGSEASQEWQANYLKNATTRLQGMIEGLDWTVEDTYSAQTLCPYETVAYGYSSWCNLFTYEEWIGFSYSIDLAFAGNNAFQNPTGRAVGLGYQQEVIARIKNHTLEYSHSQINVTLDNNEETFPLNQSLYFDFSHDTNIASILTAFGFKQFAGLLKPDAYPGPHDFTVSHITPFGARLDIEIIRTPKPFAADRSRYLDEGRETKYIHFVLNQRTLPLGVSFPECDSKRVDGWCELETFLEVQEAMPALADFDHACFGEVDVLPYGSVNDGRPI